MWSHLSEVSLYEMRACFRCARWSPRSYPTFIVCISHISKGDEPVCLWSVETKPYSEVDLFPRALPQAPSRPYQATYLDLGSSQLALGFWLLFSFDLLNFSFATLQSMRPSLFCLPCLANPPTRAKCCPCPVPLRNLINCGSSLYPQLGDQLHLWAFPRGAGWCFTCSVMDLPQPKTGRKIWGNQKIMCGHLLLYTLLHLYCLSIPDDFWVLIS